MAEDQVLAILKIVSADGREQTFQIRKSPVEIGRIPPNDVVLSSPEISRQHARILFEGDRISLVDLNSRNGTFVGATRLAPNEAHLLAYREQFRIGDFVLWLEPLPSAAEPAAVDASQIATPEQTPEEFAVVTASFPLLIENALELGPHRNGDLDAQLFGVPKDASRYMQYLPPYYEEHDLLGRFLLAFESILVPIEQTIDNFDLYLDPATTPESFLHRLASWLNLTLDEKWSLDKRRTLVAEAAELYRRRGTRWSLSRHIKIYTGAVPEINESAGRPHHFDVVLRLPAGSTVDRGVVERIIQAEQPIHTTYSLEITANG